MKVLVAVWDRKAKAYGPLMSYAHLAQATRDFGTACADPQSNLCKYPEDFELQCVGEFYDDVPGAGGLRVFGGDQKVVITASAVKDAQEVNRDGH